MNGGCRRKSLIDARSALAGMGLAAITFLFNAAEQEFIAGVISGSAYGGAGLVVGFIAAY